jgi:UDP-N-acetylmuramoyl-tripeptide--D-alanyl-D-alanine ligase
VLSASVETILGVTAGTLVTGTPDTVVTGVAIDSRDVTAGSAFVALPGERADGHQFVLQAIQRGARALLVTREDALTAEAVVSARDHHAAVVRVEDGLSALQALAKYHRSRLHCPVVGITGSTGKTTTKDLLDAVLRRRSEVVSTRGNRNNEIGVPLTILSSGPACDVVVVEMGMRGRGQIAELCDIARPTLGLITNVGTSHIELLGSVEAIAETKGELARALPVDGRVFLNGDDGYAELIAEMSAAPVTRYGVESHCDVRAEAIETDADSLPSFTLVAGGVQVPVKLNVPGRHNVYNALAAASVGLALGVSPEDAASGLESAEMTGMRMEVFTTASGVTVVNDAYNANPVSMRAALHTLAEMRPTGRRVAVLGDMAELGSLSELAHFQIGEDVGLLGIDLLVTVGPRAARIADGARARGLSHESVRACAETGEAASYLLGELAEGDAVLVKASRVMGLEAVVESVVTPS